MIPEFAVMLFSTDPAVISRAEAGGVGGIIVDWENLGKQSRQAGVDTQINFETLEDLRRVRRSTTLPVICRINRIGETTRQEVDDAVAAGADEILVPMVRRIEDVETALRIADSRCRVGILVETLDAVDASAELGRLPVSRTYVGLNDLAIDRGTPNIFEALTDGTVERVREHFRQVPFGFGGLTLPDRGFPIPCRLLIGEMSRLGCDFSFLRRSFHRDIAGTDPANGVLKIREGLAAAGQRSPEEVASDLHELQRAVAEATRWLAEMNFR